MTEALPAGRELDALVAEKVMGHTLKRQPIGAGIELIHDDEGPHGHLAYYSTDIAAAWEVLERIRQQRVSLSLRWAFFGHPDNSRWWIEDNLDRGPQADTAALAICRAALLVVGRAPFGYPWRRTKGPQ